jgi:hypothetical protein
MKTGIIEICVEGHYVVVNALIKTYLSDPENEVVVFTTPAIKALLTAQNDDQRLSFVVMETNSDVGTFINSMNNYGLDRIHYSTISMYYKEFSQFVPNKGCKEFFHFHNIDLWFVNAFKLQVIRLYKVVRSYRENPVNLFTHLKYSIKDIVWDFHRKKVIKKMINRRCFFILLSEAQKIHLRQFVKNVDIVIFPSLVFERKDISEMQLYKDGLTKIRVCVPGAVTQTKKEYDKFLLVIEKNITFYKTNYIFDLLGRIHTEEKTLYNRILFLEEAGLEIYYYNKFIDVIEFDRKLYISHIILSNMYIEEGRSMQIKETAAVYQMIHGAKPGIFPEYFMLDACFSDSVIKFQNYDTLHDVFLVLVHNPHILENLQLKAQVLSLDFKPENLLKRLISL